MWIKFVEIMKPVKINLHPPCFYRLNKFICVMTGIPGMGIKYQVNGSGNFRVFSEIIESVDEKRRNCGEKNKELPGCYAGKLKSCYKIQP